MDPVVEQKRLPVFSSLQGGRAVAAIMVILFHCQVVMGLSKYWNHSWGRYLMFAHSGVELFFVLSGIVILHAHWDDIDKPARLGAFAWKRFRRIYPLYWIFLCITVPIYFLVPSYGMGYERDPGVLLESFLLITISHWQSVLPVAWTLYREVLFYFAFGFIIVNRRLGSIVLSAWFALSLCFLFFSPPGFERISAYFSPQNLLFGFGMVVLLFFRRYSIPGLPVLAIGAIGFIACAVRENMARQESIPWDIAYGVFAAFLLCGALLMERQGNLRIPLLVKLIGDASFSIYLSHYLTIIVLAKLLYPVWKRFPLPFFVPFVLMTAAALAVGIGIHFWVEKPLLRVTSKPKKTESRASEIGVSV